MLFSRHKMLTEEEVQADGGEKAVITCKRVLLNKGT